MIMLSRKPLGTVYSMNIEIYCSIHVSITVEHNFLERYSTYKITKITDMFPKTFRNDVWKQNM